MTTKILTPISTLIVACLFGWLLLSSANCWNPYLMRQDTSAFDWKILLHTDYNAFFFWKVDPLWSLLSTFSTAEEGIASYLCLALYAVLSLGLLTLFCQLTTRLYTSLFLSIAFPLSILIVFGKDFVLLQAFSWIPWSITFLLAIHRGTIAGMMSFLLALFFGLRLMHSYQYAILSFLLVFTFYKLLARNFGKNNNPFSLSISIVILLLPIVIGTNSIPYPELIGYPPLALVTADDGLAGNILPLLTTAPEIPFLDRSFFAQRVAWHSVAILVVSVAIYLFERETVAKVFCLVALVASSLAALDFYLSPSLSALMPLAVVERNLPHLLFLPLHTIWIVAAYFSFTLSSLFTSMRSSLALLPPFIFMIALICPHYTSSKPMFSNTQISSFLKKKRERVVSPSYSVIKKYGVWSADEPIDIKFRHAHKFIEEVRTSHSANTANNMLDKKSKTRWSPGKGKQEGNEWIELHLSTSTKLSGIALDVGEFVTDYPAGLKISYAMECNGTGWKVLMELSPWPGRLSYSNTGYPFFGGQSDVVIPFGKSLEMSCLKVEQTGKRNFDWSIARLRFGQTN